MDQLWAFGKLAWVKTKLYLRDPMAVFFTLAFGPLYMLMMGLIFGNTPDPALSGRGMAEIAVPAAMALIIAIPGLTAVPINTATQREAGELRRFWVTPLRPLTFFAADVAVPFALVLVGIGLMLLLGRVVIGVRPEGNPLGLLAATGLSVAAFLALGYALAGLAPTARVAMAVGNVLVYPMVVLSGASVPLEVMPATVQQIARFVPLTYMVRLFKGLWFAEGWGSHWGDVAGLLGVLAAGLLVVGLTFRWE